MDDRRRRCGVPSQGECHVRGLAGRTQEQSVRTDPERPTDRLIVGIPSLRFEIESPGRRAEQAAQRVGNLIGQPEQREWPANLTFEPVRH
jgi:hypothetical protein